MDYSDAKIKLKALKTELKDLSQTASKRFENEAIVSGNDYTKRYYGEYDPTKKNTIEETIDEILILEKTFYSEILAELNQKIDDINEALRAKLDQASSVYGTSSDAELQNFRRSEAELIQLLRTTEKELDNFKKRHPKRL